MTDTRLDADGIVRCADSYGAGFDDGFKAGIEAAAKRVNAWGFGANIAEDPRDAKAARYLADEIRNLKPEDGA